MSTRGFKKYAAAGEAYLALVSKSNEGILKDVSDFLNRATQKSAGNPTIWVYAMGLMSASAYESWGKSWKTAVASIGKVVYAYLRLRKESGVTPATYLGAENLGVYFSDYTWPPPPPFLSDEIARAQNDIDKAFIVAVHHDKKAEAKKAKKRAKKKAAAKAAAKAEAKAAAKAEAKASKKAAKAAAKAERAEVAARLERVKTVLEEERQHDTDALFDYVEGTIPEMALLASGVEESESDVESAHEGETDLDREARRLLTERDLMTKEEKQAAADAERAEEAAAVAANIGDFADFFD